MSPAPRGRLAAVPLLALALLLGMSGCTPQLGGTMTVTAYLSDSAGLFVGNDVGVLGVPVGEVTAIDPEGTRVKVTMSVDRDQPLPAGVGAVVVARSVATDRYVELTPVYRSGPKLAAGAVIDQSRTRTPVDFDEVLGALDTFARGIAGSKASRGAIASILREGSAAVDGRGTLFNRAITALSGAVDSMAGQRQQFAGTLTGLDTLTGTIAANQELAGEFVTQVSRASRLLADERANVRAALRSLSRAVEVVADFAHQHRQELVRSLDQSSDLLRSLLTRKADLEEILRVMPVTLQNLNRIIHDGRILVRVDPTVLLPLGGLFQSVCSSLPRDVCIEVGPSLLDLQHLVALVTGSKP